MLLAWSLPLLHERSAFCTITLNAELAIAAGGFKTNGRDIVLQVSSFRSSPQLQEAKVDKAAVSAALKCDERVWKTIRDSIPEGLLRRHFMSHAVTASRRLNSRLFSACEMVMGMQDEPAAPACSHQSLKCGFACSCISERLGSRSRSRCGYRSCQLIREGQGRNVSTHQQRVGTSERIRRAPEAA